MVFPSGWGKNSPFLWWGHFENQKRRKWIQIYDTQNYHSGYFYNHFWSNKSKFNTAVTILIWVMSSLLYSILPNTNVPFWKDLGFIFLILVKTVPKELQYSAFVNEWITISQSSTTNMNYQVTVKWMLWFNKILDRLIAWSEKKEQSNTRSGKVLCNLLSLIHKLQESMLNATTPIKLQSLLTT